MNQETILAQIMETGREGNRLLIENTAKTERVESQVLELNRKFDSLAGLPERVTRIEMERATEQRQATEKAQVQAGKMETNSKWGLARFGAFMMLIGNALNQLLAFLTSHLHSSHGK
jgi:hypothetical protein